MRILESLNPKMIFKTLFLDLGSNYATLHEIKTKSFLCIHFK